MAPLQGYCKGGEPAERRWHENREWVFMDANF